jgi:hypothetical protein
VSELDTALQGPNQQASLEVLVLNEGEVTDLLDLPNCSTLSARDSGR